MTEIDMSLEEQLRNWTSQTPPWEVDGVTGFFHDMKLLNKKGEEVYKQFWERYCKNRSYEPRPVLCKSDLVMRLENSIEQELGAEISNLDIHVDTWSGGQPFSYLVHLSLRVLVAQDKENSQPYKEKIE